MKYVVLEVKQKVLSIEIPIVFPSLLIHSEVAESIQHSIKINHGWDSVPIAAGDFCPIDCHCSGRSTTLNLDSRGKKDSALIHMNDYGSGLT